MARVQLMKLGQWTQARSLLRFGAARTAPAIQRAVQQEAKWFARKIKANIRDQGRTARTPIRRVLVATQKMRERRGIKRMGPLYARGDLLRSVTVKMGFMKAWIGIPKGARGRGGANLEKIGRANEFGKRVYIRNPSRAMRWMLFKFYQGIGRRPKHPTGKKGVIIIRIPKRPFMEPVFDRFYARHPVRVRTRFLGRVARNMGGLYGLVGTAFPKE
jgi:hypothetical protein